MSSHNMTCSVLALVFVAGATSLSAQRAISIPRSVGGDQGVYTLIDAKRSGDIVRSTHKRVGPSATGYTRMEVNCKTMMVRDLGYSETSPTAIKEEPSKWFELVEGSSKSDVARFVCKRTAR